MKIFISYRRSDAGKDPALIKRALEDRRWKVFLDTNSIDGGAEWPDVIEREINSCDCCLVVIGQTWLSVCEKGSAGRRLDNPNDMVRKEVSIALRRSIPVFPILLDGASMPTADGLPPELKGLTRRNGLPLRGGIDLDTDLERICRELQKHDPRILRRFGKALLWLLAVPFVVLAGIWHALQRVIFAIAHGLIWLFGPTEARGARLAGMATGLLAVLACVAFLSNFTWARRDGGIIGAIGLGMLVALVIALPFARLGFWVRVGGLEQLLAGRVFPYGSPMPRRIALGAQAVLYLGAFAGNFFLASNIVAHVRYELLMRQARAFHEDTAWDDEIRICQEAIELLPGNDSAYFRLAAAYHQKKALDAAYANYTRVLERDKKNTSALVARGIVLYEQRKFDAALQDFESSLAIDPDDFWGLAHRGRVLRMLGRYTDSVGCLTKARERDKEGKLRDFVDYNLARTKQLQADGKWTVEEASKFGAAVEGEDKPGDFVKTLDFKGNTAALNAVGKKLSSLAGLQTLVLAGVDVDDATMDAIASLENLKELDLGRGKITRNGLEKLGQAHSLERLVLRYLQIKDADPAWLNDEALQKLTPQQNLKYLDVSSSFISDKSLPRLEGFASLEELDLTCTSLTDEGLAALKPLQNLKKLHVSCPVREVISKDWGNRIQTWKCEPAK